MVRRLAHGNHSADVEWMHMEENISHDTAATGRGVLGTEDTTLIEMVEPISFAAAGDR